ncbi:deaminase domain-containing protein [Clostridium perfringens]
MLLGTISPCESCIGVIEQFKNRYPNVKLEVVYKKENK